MANTRSNHKHTTSPTGELNPQENTMTNGYINHYLETIQALDRGEPDVALVHATLAGHAAIANAIAISDGLFDQPPYPAIIRTGEARP
ncbi:hypothetical protein [Microbacterium caowuchunii]|uniref:Uncharacterized protein n=1 Tax=Microbacterium caowuchunii TaxID=2614638 RepID=A0A5N0TIA5_9MICO|nr:hypothetical protein [Microbacterium caowuchunii]KAA9134840.1 hypothetical protein F6B40_03845 [Microbacterium caowuchunii]